MVWAIGDRGPNLKLPLAVDRYGLDHLASQRAPPGAKLMPCPTFGPAIVKLQVDGDRISATRVLPLLDTTGAPLSGLPPAGTDARDAEPALDLDGNILPPDPGGADTEGVARAADGSFWVGDEYGPSLLHVAPDGRVHARWVPAGTEALFAGAAYPVLGRLLALAARRRLNRGFESLALSDFGTRLHLAFQSPLAHPDERTGRHARHVRLWALDTGTGALKAEHLYPLDAPASFRRDRDAGPVERADVKLCDMAWLGDGRLLVLERISATAKLYLVTLDPQQAADPALSNPATRPSVEEMSAADTLSATILDKQLLLSTDDHPEIGPDLEGIALLGPATLLLVNDNDFGIEGLPTRFWRIDLPESLIRR
ncbi:esterase-like activity of phytase family protein [Sphingomonas jatrophae]|uniref:Esterase-like activity of phytase n=1 Tax=Sphingomonas jatrophae TaxID=1166337 RepID=A0A1I6MD45_9SPHN|nr:esterase-like activity of phytase family protein [Sphingomonas jatrophae]SFS13624.1 Esterase-like activity of phytase [Sphingomonas jatrophae]